MVRDGRRIQGFVPFGRSFGFDVAGNDLYIGTGEAVGFDIYSADGASRASLHARGFDLAITPADVDALREAVLANVPEECRGIMLTYLESAPRPPRKAAYGAIVVDLQHHVWLGPPGIASLAHGFWRVFGQSNEYLGEVSIPAAFTPLDIGDDYILGVWADELGIQSIRVFRLIKGIT